MKHYLLLLLSFLAVTSLSAQKTYLPINRIGFGHRPSFMKKESAPTAKRADGTKFLPTHEIHYSYKNDDWVKDSVKWFSYDPVGNIIQEDDSTDADFVRISNEWNADNQLTSKTLSISKDGGLTLIPYSRITQTYDHYCPSIVISKDGYLWNAKMSEWSVTNDCYRRDISRDADNNILSVAYSVPKNGVFIPVKRITNTVDPITKQITTFKFEEVDSDVNKNPYWHEFQYIRNIKWKNYNGQIAYEYGSDEDNFDGWYETGNTVLSGILSETLPDGTVKDIGTIQVTYTDDGGYIDIYTDSDAQERITYTIDDANGSYTEEDVLYLDKNNDGVLEESEESEWDKTSYKKDDKGNIVLEESYDETGNVWQRIKRDITYDSERNNVITEVLISEWDFEKNTYNPVEKIVYDKFTDQPTKINNPFADSSLRTEVYNMSGMKMGNVLPANKHGLFIIQKGGKVIKIVK